MPMDLVFVLKWVKSVKDALSIYSIYLIGLGTYKTLSDITKGILENIGASDEVRWTLFWRFYKVNDLPTIRILAEPGIR